MHVGICFLTKPMSLNYKYRYPTMAYCDNNKDTIQPIRGDDFRCAKFWHMQMLEHYAAIITNAIKEHISIQGYA